MNAVHRTPLKQSHTLNQLTNRQVFLKLENMQRTGSFKLRGALNKICSLTDEEADRGIVCASAGNHAQGVALAASERGISAKIFMPNKTPRAKVEATRSYGADIQLIGETYQESFTAASEEMLAKGSTFVHAFDDEKVMAGQGTVALEMMQQCPDLDTIVVPVGGGGLISGVAVAAKSFHPHIKVVGVQSAGAPATYNHFTGKNKGNLNHVASIADGILVKKPGKRTYPIIEQYVDDMVTVSDEEIAYTILFMLEREKTLVEGAGATAIASLLCNKVEIGQRIGCIVSGGNVDLSKIELYRSLSKRYTEEQRLTSMS
ncbi:threonine ammonia-lyase [Pseudalkalibacillus berkeleyi]|uniref:L-threonine dehydratase catabolic TdcB n=1 Tax=Pseudalkalibacillus berkeleyi TaxID=1069813 RepID=A0ABS9H6L3_9BACL|nr:threonine ammonia-lyase [Pseudalkalibacillus berkeleyi]MCF6139518.1 threonine ammonia-lyase [Pseudalkalibacillus berkeleyi]